MLSENYYEEISCCELLQEKLREENCKHHPE